MDRLNKFLILTTMLMQIVASSHSRESSGVAQSLREMGGMMTHPKEAANRFLPRWTHSKHGAALVFPLSTSTSASPLDRYYLRSLSTTLNNNLLHNYGVHRLACSSLRSDCRHGQHHHLRALLTVLALWLPSGSKLQARGIELLLRNPLRRRGL